ncbi:hypothetical protein [Limnovirga soli]|uniref:Tetratricopeptide repeat protein n=1 Tax=Limnovirga soli TaxID=2656915 RepID=A0A8J8JXQ6_9BACT|nr:hypothetical protein [Limnovirga soli]NNV56571.1 hypothetical protein [Limnovirga soli]
MPNRNTDELFQLIKSLDKGEKRNFKLYIKRISGYEDLKSVLLFDALDKMEVYDEEYLLKKHRSIKKQQLSNMKAGLYKQLLASLRHSNDDDNIDMQLNEQMSYARILYNKGLYLQALKVLGKIKHLAKEHYQLTFQMQALFFEKKIEALHITRSLENRAERLSFEIDDVNMHLSQMSSLSNLSLQLYGLYIKMGHARDEKDVEAVKTFFEANLPVCHLEDMQFYEKLYLYQSYCWYNFILQDLLMYYRYSQKWVDLFEQEPFMKKVEAGQYIKGIHNLLSAHFDLSNYDGFNDTLHRFETFSTSDYANINANARIQTFVYLHIAKINKHFLEGTFEQGLELVPYIEEKLKEYQLQLDRHRILVFYYKIACLYFGSGNNEKAIDYLNKIIHLKVDLRTDLQCYARLLHLIAHYELGNHQLLEYLIKSVYRFMAKMKNLSVVEEEIFKFLRKSFALAPDKMIPAFVKLKEKLQGIEGKPLESRSFMYLDIIAWLESKIQHVPVQEVRRVRFLSGRKTK